MTGPRLIYFADPMCSWCWGFSPVIDALRERFGPALPIRLILGGLRPGTTQPLNDASKREIREHWDHVRDASGQPFDFSFFDREGFVYNDVDLRPLVCKLFKGDHIFERRRIHLARA